MTGGHIAWPICLLTRILRATSWDLPMLPVQALHCKGASAHDVGILVKHVDLLFVLYPCRQLSATWR